MHSGELTRRAPRHSLPALERARVVVIEGPDAGLSAELGAGDTLTIGVSPDNDLVLTDPTVSRYHLELRIDGPHVVVEDLGSLNGTLVGEAQIDRGRLRPETELTLGDERLLLEDAGKARADAAPEDARVEGLVAESAAMRAVAHAVRRLGPTDVSVLLQGETGTGKEVIARAIHDCSPREPFVVVDCGSLPPNLIASELFGHERGAFTGADQRRVGAFELAHGGTLFLDEIGELPLELQPALLGVLERRRFRRVGGTKDVEVDVRVLAATHRDLRPEANHDAFRPDLYFRLAVTRIVIPPLRERREDIEPLIRHFVRQRLGHDGPLPFDVATLDTLIGQHWSGNVRELRNVVDAAVALGELPPAVPAQGESGQAGGPIRTYKDARREAVERFERTYLSDLIEKCDGNASEAARRARMDRPYLLTLLRKHGLR